MPPSTGWRKASNASEALVNGVTDYAIYMLDRDGIISNWNAGAERIKGYSADEIVGQHLLSSTPSRTERPGRPPARSPEPPRPVATRPKAGACARTAPNSGRSVVVDAIYGDSGELIGFAKVTRDLTEKRGGRGAAPPVPKDGSGGSADRRVSRTTSTTC